MSSKRPKAGHPLRRKPKTTTFPDDPYHVWLQSERKIRGRGVGVRDLLSLPPIACEELPGVFAAATLEQLACGWVALVSDQLRSPDFNYGGIVRALNVVARRLHGVNSKDQKNCH
jgi:hypothetical protein